MNGLKEACPGGCTLWTKLGMTSVLPQPGRVRPTRSHGKTLRGGSAVSGCAAVGPSSLGPRFEPVGTLASWARAAL